MFTIFYACSVYIIYILTCHSQMVIICYLCSTYFIYGWPMFTMCHICSQLIMSPMLNAYYICIPSPFRNVYHMSSIFIKCHLSSWYVMSFCDMSPYVICVYVSSILLCIMYIHHMSSQVVICWPYVTYVYYMSDMFTICHLCSLYIPIVTISHTWLWYSHYMSHMFIICHICILYVTYNSDMFTMCNLCLLYVTYIYLRSCLDEICSQYICYIYYISHILTMWHLCWDMFTICHLCSLYVTIIPNCHISFTHFHNM